MAGFSQDNVWSQVTPSGFRQQVLVMYHGTSVSNAIQILEGNGFNISNGPNQMLGNGLYVSKDINKALNYGSVVFRLLVYPGLVAVIDHQEHPLQKTWQKEHGSAWVPPNCGMVPSGLEENCVKSAKQVRILGVSVGWNLLPYRTRTSVRDCSSNFRPEQLSSGEEEVLNELLLDRGIIYHIIAFIGGVLADKGHREQGNRVSFLYHPLYQNDSNLYHIHYWTVTWDGCIENQLTGRVLKMKRNRKLAMSNYARYGPNAKYQKWKLDSMGALVNKFYSQPVLIQQSPEQSVWHHGKPFTLFKRNMFQEDNNINTSNDCNADSAQISMIDDEDTDNTDPDPRSGDQVILRPPPTWIPRPPPRPILRPPVTDRSSTSIRIPMSQDNSVRDSTNSNQNRSLSTAETKAIMICLILIAVAIVILILSLLVAKYPVPFFILFVMIMVGFLVYVC